MSPLSRRTLKSTASALLLLLLSASASAGPQRVEVQWVNDPRLPSLDAPARQYVLDQAAKLTRTATGAEVTFESVAEATAQETLDLHRQRFRPLSILDPDAIDPSQLTNQQVLEVARASVGQFGAIAKYTSVLGPTPADGENLQSLAQRVAERYLKQVNALLGLKGSDGSPLTAGPTGPLHRLSCWSNMLHFGGKDGVLRLRMFNGILLEDMLTSASPHTLAQGSAFGFAHVGPGNSVVAYHLLLRPTPDLSPRVVFAADTDQHRLNCIAYVIAYVIAHEIAAHQILLAFDAFTPESGVLLPIVALSDPRQLQPAQPTLPPGPRLDRRTLRAGSLEVRLRIAIVRRDTDNVEAELKALESLDVDESVRSGILDRAAKLMEKW